MRQTPHDLCKIFHPILKVATWSIISGAKNECFAGRSQSSFRQVKQPVKEQGFSARDQIK